MNILNISFNAWLYSFRTVYPSSTPFNSLIYAAYKGKYSLYKYLILFRWYLKLYLYRKVQLCWVSYPPRYTVSHNIDLNIQYIDLYFNTLHIGADILKLTLELKDVFPTPISIDNQRAARYVKTVLYCYVSIICHAIVNMHVL